MKIAGFDDKGRIIVDGEGETIRVADSELSKPIVLQNVNIERRGPLFEAIADNVRVSVVTGDPLDYPIRISILGGCQYGGNMGDLFGTCLPGDILQITEAKHLIDAIQTAIKMYTESIA
jgi:hypothetical protein